MFVFDRYLIDEYTSNPLEGYLIYNELLHSKNDFEGRADHITSQIT
jgi:hypothetical protein